MSYAQSRAGEPITAPAGWRILEEGVCVPLVHRLYFEASGWTGIRRFHGSVTPNHASVCGAVRAVAVPMRQAGAEELPASGPSTNEELVTTAR